MGRLIDADIVIRTLKETGIIHDNDLGHLVIDEINRIPTAYDTDRVVAELEYKKELYEVDASYWAEHSWKDNSTYNESDLSLKKACCYEHALEVVRKGGVE